MRAGKEAVVPSGALVEVSHQDEQLIGGRVQARGEGGNGVAEIFDLARRLGRDGGGQERAMRCDERERRRHAR